MEVPPGIDTSDSRKTLIIGVISMLLSLAFVAVALRVYARGVLIKQFGFDDAAAVVAYLLVFSSRFCVLHNTRNGFATHVYFLKEAQIKEYMKTFYISIVFYNAALFGIKITFLLQYWRVLAVHKMRKVLTAAMVLVFAWSISQVLVEIFICTPISAFWDPQPGGRCVPNLPQWYINAAGNIITDIMIFILPLPVIGKLNLARGHKYVLIGIFSLGFFTCTLSFVRIKFLHLTKDFTWDNVESACWSIAELSSGVICSCLPTFRPLLGRFVPPVSSRLKRSDRNYQRQTGPNEARPQDRELRRLPKKPGSSESKVGFYGETRLTACDSDSANQSRQTSHIEVSLGPR